MSVDFFFFDGHFHAQAIAEEKTLSPAEMEEYQKLLKQVIYATYLSCISTRCCGA
jgi:hypothetical protein